MTSKTLGATSRASRTKGAVNGKREWNNFINFSVKNIFIKLKIVKPCDII